MEETSTPTEPKQALKPYFIIALVITVILSALAISLAAYSYFSASQKVVDSSQVLAAIFSLVALSWIIVSFRQQQEALNQQHQALVQTQQGIAKQLEADHLLKKVEFFFEERQRLRQTASTILIPVAEACLAGKFAPEGAGDVVDTDFEILRRRAKSALGTYGGSLEVNPTTRLLELIRAIEMYDHCDEKVGAPAESDFEEGSSGAEGFYVDISRGLLGIINKELWDEAEIDYDQDGISPRFGRQLMPGLELSIISYLRETKGLADFCRDETQIHPLVARFGRSDETKLAVVLSAYAYVLIRKSVCTEIDLEDISFEHWRSVGIEHYDSDIGNWPWMITKLRSFSREGEAVVTYSNQEIEEGVPC